MATHLSESQIQSDTRNHCSSILEYFPSTDDSYLILVMPYLLPFYEPGFEFVDEVIEFINQTLEVFFSPFLIMTGFKALSGLDIPTR